MTYKDAQSFWENYLTLIRGSGHRGKIHNPLQNIPTEEDNPDHLSAEQLFQKERAALEFSSFWEDKPTETAGNILINALSMTNLSDADCKALSKILADASLHTDYSRYEKTISRNTGGWENAADIPDNPFEPIFDNIGNMVWTPRQIYDYLDASVYGQEEAKRAASMLVYHHYHKHRRNLIMSGPSGCGKTEIWRTLAKKFHYIKIVNGPQIACDGWKGSYHIKDIFMEESHGRASHLIIVIDEADKLFEPAISSNGIDFARKIQNELLKIMDGDTLTFTDDNGKKPSCTVSCQNVSVVFCGSFEHMNNRQSEASRHIGFLSGDTASPSLSHSEEDFMEYGNIRQEIMGRINQIVTLQPLTATDFLSIMNSPASPIEKIGIAHNVVLQVDEATRQQLAEEAARSGLGCRYIRSRLQAMLDEQMFQEPDRTRYTLSLSQEERKEEHANQTEPQTEAG